MRITNKIIQNNSITNINNNKVMEDKLNTQLATGKKVNRPSDDPVVAIRALRLRTSLSEVEQYYTKNVPDAKSWLSITENAVKSVTDVITSMYEDFTSGAAGFKTPEDREAILENLKGLRDEIYSIGNADYAGRHVFTGYRTDTSLTFTENTVAEYREIKDTFNASDVGRATYVEGTLNTEDLNGLVTDDNDQTTVMEDRINRIRLSYDNLDGVLKETRYTGYRAGDEAGTISGWGSSTDISKYYEDEGKGPINSDGKSFSGTVTVDGQNVVLSFKDEDHWTGQLAGHPEVTAASVDSSVTGRESKLTFDGKTYTVTCDKDGNYSADGLAVTKKTDGTLDITIPADGAGSYPIVINTDGNLTTVNKAEEVRAVDDKVDVTSMAGIDLSSITIREKDESGNLTVPYKITKGADGKFSIDKHASVKENADGTVTYTLPGPNGTMDMYKTITIDPSTGSLSGMLKHTRTYDYTLHPGGNLGDCAVGGNVYAARAIDTTSLVYRRALEGSASVDQSSIDIDPTDGMQEFELNYGAEKYIIKKFTDDGRPFHYESGYFAVDPATNTIDHSIRVTQNTDKSFTISHARDGADYETAENYHVFNVSADGRNVTSCYSEKRIDVTITSSDMEIAADDEGNGLTAYQYFALDDKNENRYPAASEKAYLLADTGELVFGSKLAKTLSELKDIDGVDTISVTYSKTNFEKGDIRPEHYFDAKMYDEKHIVSSPLIYDEQDQEINYTIGTNQSIRINTNASEVFDPQVARVLDDIINNIEEVKAAEEKVNRLKGMKADTATYGAEDQKKIDILLDTAQKALTFLTDKLQKQFEGGLTNSQGFLDKANTALTAIGNRSARVDLVENRLQSQSTNFKTLSSENEDADITEVAVQLSSAEMSYQGALMATGKIAQTTLLNYL